MCQIPENFVTSDLVYHLRCDKPKFQRSSRRMSMQSTWHHARFLFVFENADLHTAAHCLAERMHEPFEPFPIACVAVQQTVHDDFIERVRDRFHQVKPHVATNPNFEQSQRELKMGGIEHLVAPEINAPRIASPIIVTGNVTHLFFSSRPSGMVTLKSFNNVREAADIFISEQPPFDAVHVFDESIANVYVLAKRIQCDQFFVNCFDVCMMPILQYFGLREPRALLHGGYHYESVELAGIWRMIVFPVVTTFVRRCCCPKGQCVCYANHHICCD